MKDSTYVRLELPAETPVAAREALADVVLRLAARFSFQGLEDWAVDLPRSTVLGAEREFHDLRMAREPHPEMRVYFARKTDAGLFARALRAGFADLKVSNPRTLGQRDWMKEWRKHYQVQKLKEGRTTLAIVPSWKKTPSSTLAVRISPGQAFGTGTHATTQLCLRLFLRHVSLLPEKCNLRFLDFGAGTGVLAIAAEKWARSHGRALRALAVESDPVALEQCGKNLRLNRSRSITKARKAPAGKKYELIFANVLAPVLLAERELLQEALVPGGVLILSGILAAEAEQFLQNFRATGFAVVEKAEQAEWCAILLQKRGGKRQN
jgi:ribosomal protein L11 methyltransferase